jgi:DNA-binding response OmpR family regulator
MRILVVEDDPALRLGLRRTLLSEGWQVDEVADGSLALSATVTADFDLVVLDLNLPRLSGMDVLKTWRQSHKTHSVLILSARDESLDRIAGLNEGADDYLIKPFEPAELVARIRAIMRRMRGQTVNIIKLGRLTFNTETRELNSDSFKIALTSRESALVELLISADGNPVSKTRIMSTMSSWEADFSSNAVEIYILKLRRKMIDTNVTIKTIRGFGYSMQTES